MIKEIAFDVEAKTKLLNGVNILSNAVKSTLGPKGSNVMIEMVTDGVFGIPVVTKDGVTVAQAIHLKDPIENMGAQLVKSVSAKTADVAGDGTSTSAVLTQAIVNKGFDAINDGHNVMSIKRGIDKATRAVVEFVKQMSVPVSSKGDIAKVAMISANNDEIIGTLIAEAIDAVGKDGIITIGEDERSHLDMSTGMKVDRGYASDVYVGEGSKWDYEHPRVIVTTKKIQTQTEIVKILENVMLSNNTPVVLFCDGIEGDAYDILVANVERGACTACVVKTPGSGDRKRAVLGDIASITGATVFGDGTRDILGITQADFGGASRITIDKDATSIVEGKCADSDSVRTRIENVQSQIETSTSDADKMFLQSRLSKLSGAVACLYVGGLTEVELKEATYRVEDALHATRAAIDMGIVPGGGVTLLHIQEALRGVSDLTFRDESEGIGWKIVVDAIDSPFRTIVENCGENPDDIIKNIRDESSACATEDEHTIFGYDAFSGSIVDMFDVGIIDPAKVTITAISNASSVAGMILSTSCTIHNERTNK